jgi:hypothetical protein
LQYPFHFQEGEGMKCRSKLRRIGVLVLLSAMLAVPMIAQQQSLPPNVDRPGEGRLGADRTDFTKGITDYAWDTLIIGLLIGGIVGFELGVSSPAHRKFERSEHDRAT